MAELTSQIRTLSFDIGGVFLLGKADKGFFARWAERLGLDAETFGKRLWHGPDIEHANIGQISAEEYFERAALRLDTDPHTIRTIIQEVFAGELNHDLADYVRRLKKHVRVTALTNNWSFVHDHIKQREIDDLFDVIVNSADVGVRKPDPRIYQIMLHRLNANPNEVVFIDDTLENIEAAQALGIPCIHFESTGQVIAELNQLLF